MSEALLQAYQLGSMRLPNRIIMAPMTRNRVDNSQGVPVQLMAEYYAQRAAAGLIISEGTFVSREAAGFIRVPGLFSAQQIEGWARVTSAVHDKGGRIFAQLWHVGAVSHPDLLDGALPLAPSAINPMTSAYTNDGFKPTVTPRAMTAEVIGKTVQDFRSAAANAAKAGFDGVELHGANGYLFHQFFARSMNKRTDAFGGTIENRGRFLFDVLAAVQRELPNNRIGLRINPTMHGLSGIEFDEETMPLFEYIVDRLNAEKLAYLHVMEPINPVDLLPKAIVQPSVVAHFRKLYKGTLIGAVDYTRETATQAIAHGYADLIAFGRAFIANPDLVQRFALHAPLAQPHRETFYTEGPAGYVDYPSLGVTAPQSSSGDRVLPGERYGETRRRMRAPTNLRS